jgi:hypothetical protein
MKMKNFSSFEQQLFNSLEGSIFGAGSDLVAGW